MIRVGWVKRAEPHGGSAQTERFGMREIFALPNSPASDDPPCQRFARPTLHPRGNPSSRHAGIGTEECRPSGCTREEDRHKKRKRNEKSCPGRLEHREGHLPGCSTRDIPHSFCVSVFFVATSPLRFRVAQKRGPKKGPKKGAQKRGQSPSGRTPFHRRPQPLGGLSRMAGS
jgi:hypothetical protein